MALTARWYGQAKLRAFRKEIDYLNDNIRVSLHTATYVPNQDTHVFYSSVTNEVVGTGYTAGGAALASKTLTYDAASNKIRFGAAMTQWPGSTITARWAVIRDATPALATAQPLLGYIDFGADLRSFGGAFMLEWHADGILTITAAT